MAAEIARHLSRRVALSVGGSVERYSPTSSTPDPSTIGPAYEKWIAPELGVLATEATGWATRGTLHFQVTARNALWLSAQYRSVSPDSRSQPLPDTPIGDRQSFFVTAGATLTPR